MDPQNLDYRPWKSSEALHIQNRPPKTSDSNIGTDPQRVQALHAINSDLQLHITETLGHDKSIKKIQRPHTLNKDT